MSNTPNLMNTAEATALVSRKSVELNGVMASSTNSKYVRAYGKIVFRVVCVKQVGAQKFWAVEN